MEQNRKEEIKINKSNLSKVLQVIIMTALFSFILLQNNPLETYAAENELSSNAEEIELLEQDTLINEVEKATEVVNVPPTTTLEGNKEDINVLVEEDDSIQILGDNTPILSTEIEEPTFVKEDEETTEIIVEEDTLLPSKEDTEEPSLEPTISETENDVVLEEEKVEQDTATNTTANSSPATLLSTTAVTQEYVATKNSEVSVYQDPNSTQTIGKLFGEGITYQVLKKIDANWIGIQYGGSVGYIHTSDVSPSSASNLKNVNPGLPVYKTNLNSDSYVTIYEAASESANALGIINPSQNFSTFGTNGPEFIVIDVGGRLGFVKRKYFLQNDKYLATEKEQTLVYSDTSGTRNIGTLSGINEKYRIEKVVNDNWAIIHYAGNAGFIRIQDVSIKNGVTLENANPGLIVHKTGLQDARSLPIYTNANAQSSVLGYLSSGQSFKTYGTNGPRFIVVDIGGRLGFVERKYFLPGDQYIATYQTKTQVYSDISGKQSIGYLNGANESYQILKVVNDNWIAIHYAGNAGFIHIQDVSIKSGVTLKNANPGLIVYKTGLQDFKSLPIYIAASFESPVIGYLSNNQTFKTYGTNGPNFIVVDIGGRLGFVKRLYFQTSDRYLTTYQIKTQVYSDTSGKQSIGYLNGANESYQILQVINDNWVVIHYAGNAGFIRIQDVTPQKEATLQNANPGLIVFKTGLKGYEPLNIYSTASLSSPVIGQLSKGQLFKTYGTNGPRFIVVDIGGRLGFIEQIKVNNSIVRATNYPYTLTEMLNKQMNVYGTPPQDWYTNYGAYISSSALNKIIGSDGKAEWLVVGADVWNVRSGPSTSNHILGTLKRNDKILEVFEENIGGWTKINFYKTLSYTKDAANNVLYKEFYRPFVNASNERTSYYLNPENFKDDPQAKYQFLDLSQPAYVNITDVNQRILSQAGILTDKAEAFSKGAQQYSINEIYLISHALLETGYGSSKLATGVPIKVLTDGSIKIVEDTTKEKPDTIVYNMYGIGAVDSNPLLGGAQKAYNEKWFTPEAAIIGGAQFVRGTYIDVGQNTLYKMRWNPDNPGTHQYATDIAWATKQTKKIYEMYSQLSEKREVFDIPVFR